MTQNTNPIAQLVARWLSDGTEMISESTSITKSQPIVDDLRDISAQLERIGDLLETQNLISAAAADLLDDQTIGPLVRPTQ